MSHMTQSESRPGNPSAITASRALFIKLGSKGEWEEECIRDGTLRLKYAEVPSPLCHSAVESDDWSAVEKALGAITQHDGARSRHLNQIRDFYTAGRDVLWVTFHADRLWWCFSGAEVQGLNDGSKVRRVVADWSDLDLLGRPLYKRCLSGRILAVQAFQGTICAVPCVSYLVAKLNGVLEPHVAAVQSALQSLQNALIPIIRGLHPEDFEVLVDLIFRHSGWQRLGSIGKTQKAIDIELFSPVTHEYAAVQVKSTCGASELEAYRTSFSEMRGYTRFYFVTHSAPDVVRRAATSVDDPNFVFWDAEQVASRAVSAGLTSWLLDKAS